MYAVGDVTSVGTPKAGVFAEGQAAVVADAIIAQHRGDADPTTYDGRGICYLEFGDDQVAQVDVTFLSGEAPAGELEGPSLDARRRQGRVRIEPHPPLVRPRMVRLLSARTARSGRNANFGQASAPETSSDARIPGRCRLGAGPRT